MTKDEYFSWLKTEDGGFCTEVKEISPGIYAAVKPLLFHWTMIIGMIGDTSGYSDRYCFANKPLAENALKLWDGQGEPIGWHRHPASGRRRPDGNVSKEYINP